MKLRQNFRISASVFCPIWLSNGMNKLELQVRHAEMILAVARFMLLSERDKDLVLMLVDSMIKTPSDC